MDFNIDTIAYRGRTTNAIAMVNDKSIVITCDILKHNNNKPNTQIVMEDLPKKIQIISDSIDILSNLSADGKTPQSVVLGETLVEILKWIIQVMVTHSHPPNAPPINTFFKDAQDYSNNMEELILNKNVRTK